jgi:hypothetical protein
MKIKLSLVLLTLLFSMSCFGTQETSIISLLAKPERYEGEWIALKGIVSLERHHNLLYLDQWSYEYAAEGNAIPLSINANINYSHFNGVASIVYGEFKKSSAGIYVLRVESMVVAAKRERLSSIDKKE